MSNLKFKSISELIEFMKKDDHLLPFEFDSSQVSHEVIDTGNSEVVPSLNKYNSIYVYRGQHQRYKRCRPSLFREGFDRLDSISYLNWIIYKAKLSEFTNLLDSPRSDLANEIGLNINVEALAQHYGLKTMHIDVTHCLKVASFFACCKLHDNKWEPISSGIGVMYRLPFIPGITGDIVGVQVHPRPKEQLAESVKVDINQDFERKRFVETYEFEHSLNESKKIFDSFNGGKDLFPYDPLSDKADLIINDQTLSIHTVRRIMKEDGVSELTIESKIDVINALLNNSGKGGISERNEYQFAPQEIESMNDELKTMKQSLLSNVGFRVAYLR